MFGGSLTGGPQGISAIDKIDLPLVARFGALDLRPWYWFALALVLLMLLVNFRLRDSRLGRAWVATREDEAAAASLGVPLVRTKLLAYGVGAALGGVSGAFLASYLSTVNPHQFTVPRSRSSSSRWSCSAGWARSGASSSARSSCRRSTTTCCRRSSTTSPARSGSDFDLSEVSSGVYGFLLVIVMLLRPDGLLPERRRGVPAEDSNPHGLWPRGPKPRASTSSATPAIAARTASRL